MLEVIKSNKKSLGIAEDKGKCKVIALWKNEVLMFLLTYLMPALLRLLSVTRRGKNIV